MTAHHARHLTGRITLLITALLIFRPAATSFATKAAQLNEPYESPSSLVITSGGGYLVGGTYGDGDSTNAFLKRFLVDGSPDPAFRDGEPACRFPPPLDKITSVAVRDVAIQPDGTIIAICAAYGYESPIAGWALIKYLPDGTPDLDFIAHQELHVGAASGVALQPDGRIVVAASDGLRRFEAGGALDTSFGQTGTVAESADGTSGDVAVLADGRIETARIRSGSPSEPTVLTTKKYTPAGSPDLSYGVGGVAQVTVARPGGSAKSFRESTALIASGGEATGVTAVSSTKRAMPVSVSRISADGHADSTFGHASSRLRSRNGFAAALGHDGSLLLGGTLGRGRKSQRYVARLTNGRLSKAFGRRGVSTTRKRRVIRQGSIEQIGEATDGTIYVLYGVADYSRYRLARLSPKGKWDA